MLLVLWTRTGAVWVEKGGEMYTHLSCSERATEHDHRVINDRGGVTSHGRRTVSRHNTVPPEGETDSGEKERERKRKNLEMNVYH